MSNGKPPIGEIQRFAGPSFIQTVGHRQVRATFCSPGVKRDGNSVRPENVRFRDWLNYGGPMLDSHKIDVPVAKCIEAQADSKSFRGLFQFPDEGVNPDSDRVYAGIKAGLYGATSIGFRPTRITPLKNGTGYSIDECDLIEVSVVTTPADCDALITERSSKRAGKALSTENAAHIKTAAKSAAVAADRCRRVLTNAGELADSDPDDDADDSGISDDAARAARARKAKALKLRAAAQDAAARKPSALSESERRAKALKLAGSR